MSLNSFKSIDSTGDNLVIWPADETTISKNLSFLKISSERFSITLGSHKSIGTIVHSHPFEIILSFISSNLDVLRDKIYMCLTDFDNS